MKTMSEESKLMTNRQLSQLCAKGICEWCYKEEQKVRSNYEYLCSESDISVSDQVMIRPFEEVIFTDADKNTWYTPTKEAFNALIGGDRTRHILGL